jgi:hypothetical protein
MTVTEVQHEEVFFVICGIAGVRGRVDAGARARGGATWPVRGRRARPTTTGGCIVQGQLQRRCLTTTRICFASRRRRRRLRCHLDAEPSIDLRLRSMRRMGRKSVTVITAALARLNGAREVPPRDRPGPIQYGIAVTTGAWGRPLIVRPAELIHEPVGTPVYRRTPCPCRRTPLPLSTSTFCPANSHVRPPTWPAPPPAAPPTWPSPNPGRRRKRRRVAVAATPHAAGCLRPVARGAQLTS